MAPDEHHASASIAAGAQEASAHLLACARDAGRDPASFLVSVAAVRASSAGAAQPKTHDPPRPATSKTPWGWCTACGSGKTRPDALPRVLRPRRPYHDREASCRLTPSFAACRRPTGANWRIRSSFERAGGRCAECGREHGATVLVIAGGGWLDPETGECHDDRGRSLGWCRQSDWPAGRLVKTILTCAHLDQNPAHNDPA